MFQKLVKIKYMVTSESTSFYFSPSAILSYFYIFYSEYRKESKLSSFNTLIFYNLKSSVPSTHIFSFISLSAHKHKDVL